MNKWAAFLALQINRSWTNVEAKLKKGNITAFTLYQSLYEIVGLSLTW